jgi:hypothetical protein
MARGETGWYRRLAWLLALALPWAAQAGTDKPTGPDAIPIPEPGMLEFLAEEPDVGDGIEEALLKDDADRAIDRMADQDKVKKDEDAAY